MLVEVSCSPRMSFSTSFQSVGTLIVKRRAIAPSACTMSDTFPESMGVGLRDHSMFQAS